MEVINLPEDMTPEEKEALREFKKNGCPGLLNLNADKIYEGFKLYLSGKTYNEIANIANIKKPLLLYISEKGKWNDKKMQKYQDIAENIAGKVRNTRLNSVNTLSTAIMAVNQYFEKKFNKYLSTNDDSIIDKLDTKLMAQLNKYVESLEKLIASANSDDINRASSGVNININQPSEIQTSEPSDSIDTENIKNTSEMLKTLLSLKNKK